MTEGIIFDAYGTLINTGEGSIQAAERILEKNKKNIDAKIFYKKWKYYHKKHEDSLKYFVVEEDIFLMDLILLYKEYEIKGNPENDVKIMLDTLGKRNSFPETNVVLNALRPNYQLFIGSNSDDIPLRTDIERNGIEVNKVFTSESLKVYKPKKEFYLFILYEIKMRPDEVLFVGDSLTDDVLGPAKLGIKTVWLNNKNIAYDQNYYKPLYEINNLNQLLDISF